MEKIKIFIHHLFIPHEENNFRAKSLHTDFLTAYLVFAFLMMMVFKQGNIHDVLGFATDISVDKLYQLTNEQRQKNNLPSLVLNSASGKLLVTLFSRWKNSLGFYSRGRL